MNDFLYIHWHRVRLKGFEAFQLWLLAPKSGRYLLHGLILCTLAWGAFLVSQVFWAGMAFFWEETAQAPSFSSSFQQTAQQTAFQKTPRKEIPFAALSESTWFGESRQLAQSKLAVEDVAAETHLNLTLKGTMFGAFPHAIIEDNATGKTHLVRAGEDVLGGVTLAQVGRRRVVLENNGKTEHLSLPFYESLETSGGTRLVSRGRGDETRNYTIMYERPPSRRQKIVLDKTDVTAALSNLGALSKEARLIPRVAGATVEGYKITRMKNNSFLSKLSLKEGDVLLKLNDVLISNREKIFPVLMNLKHAKKAELLINRRGETIALEVEVGV